MEFWLWICILIGSIILEFVSFSALISIWFSIGAIASLIATQLEFSFFWQVLIFFSVSFAFIFICRPIAKKYFQRNVVPTNADRIIGEQAQLLEEITPYQWGLIKIQGVSWHAVSYDKKAIGVGETVQVLNIEDSKVIVKKI